MKNAIKRNRAREDVWALVENLVTKGVQGFIKKLVDR